MLYGMNMFLEVMPRIIDAIDVMIDGNERLTDKQSRALYERFFDREKYQAALLEMRQDLQRVLTELLNFISSGSAASEENGRLSPYNQLVTG
jgi:hypothetical protein